MPRVTRRRAVGSSPETSWEFLTEPRNLPKWWPRTTSVRSISGAGNVKGSRWTQVLQAKSGNRLGAEMICTAASEPTLWRFEQETDDTPFERMMSEAWTEIRINPKRGSGSEIELELGQRLRGMSRLGFWFVRSASRRTAEQALSALEEALSGGKGEERVGR